MRRSFWLWASVALNAFLLAYVSAQFFQTRSRLVATMQPPALVQRVADRLPENDARLLWESYRSREGELVKAQSESMAALRKAAAFMSQSAIDAEAFRIAVIDARDKRMAVGALVVEVFLDALPKMSVEGRSKLVRLQTP